MFELLADALKSLAAYPPLAALGGFTIIIGGGLYLLRRGERDRKTGNGSQSIPSWALYGPAHDAMQSVHNISECARAMVKSLDGMEREQREQTQLLEDIRNNFLSNPGPVRRR